MNPRVKTVSANSDYTLTIEFTNGETKIFDVKPYLGKGVFAALSTKEIFMQAAPVLGTVAWPDDIDQCPDTLYLDSK